MSSRKKQVKKALENQTLQTALERASAQHHKKYKATRDGTSWDELKQKARAIREDCSRRLPELIQTFVREAENAGAVVTRTSTVPETLDRIKAILEEKNARLIVKAKSMVSEEIGLNRFLEGMGCEVVESDLGEWIVQLAGERPSHITAPALHKTKEEIAELLSRHLGKDVPPDAAAIARIARAELRRFFVEADVGLSGANLAIAESGTLVLVSNEGNARLTTALPPVHIAVVTVEKFVETLEQATALLKPLITSSSGAKITSYVSFITGPSRTTDIEKELVIGVHGPLEVYIIIMDNGRLALARDDDLNRILHCLKCGGCMLVCPVFQNLGGHVFGGPVYPGGIGLLLTAATRSPAEVESLLGFCADCRKCVDFCPVGIPTPDLLLKLKQEQGLKTWEKALSRLFLKTKFMERSAGVFSILQKLWQKNGRLKKLPGPWTRNKALPVLKPRKIPESAGQDGPKVYLFAGCLAKLFFPEIGASVVSSLSRAGYRVISPEDQVCCGAPSWHLGQKDDVATLLAKNLASWNREAPDFIITVCPTGQVMLRETYPKLEPSARDWSSKIFSFTEFMVRRDHIPKKGSEPDRGDVYYHYPCHGVHELGLKQEPLILLESLGYKPRVEEEPYACCGFCGVFSVKNPEISARLWEKKRNIIAAENPPLIATDCPGCLFQIKAGLDSGEGACEVLHSAEIFDRIITASQTD